MAESTEARVQALIEQIRIFARLRIQETKTAASDDFRATEQHFDKLESALRAELGKDAERLDFLCHAGANRMIEEEKGQWRVYQDVAPPEGAYRVWQGMTNNLLATPREAIDAAIQQTKDTK